MNSECFRIGDQLRRAFFGDAWHGPSLRELLGDVTCEVALAHHLPSAHCIWQLVLHIDFWASAAFNATQGISMPGTDATEGKWPEVADGSASAWPLATEHMFGTGERLARAIEGFDDSRLQKIVPGR